MTAALAAVLVSPLAWAMYAVCAVTLAADVWLTQDDHGNDWEHHDPGFGLGVAVVFGALMWVVVVAVIVAAIKL